MSARTRGIRMRVALLGAALASTIALLVALTPGAASAADPGFCEGAHLSSSNLVCTGPGPGPVNSILAEVTSGNAEICVRFKESEGVHLFKSCGQNRASTAAGGLTGWPEIIDPHGASITVTGFYTT
jgi:hypothetical protein